MTNQKGLSAKDWLGVAVAAVVGAGLVLWFAAAKASPVAPPRSAPASQVAHDGTQEARNAWARFDQLAPHLQTKEALGDHFKQANGADPSIPLRRYNGGQFRKRFARVLGNGAFVEGDDLDILVPGQTMNECIAWGVANLDQATKDALLTMQFSAVRCYRNTDTDGGKSIAKEWPIP